MRAFLLSLLVFKSACGWADKGAVEIWGSGHGVWVGSQLHLLDLVESGYVEADLERHSWELMPHLRAQFNEVNKEVFYPDLIDQLTQKLYEIWVLDHFFAEAILKAIKLYQWNLVTSPLVKKPVENAFVQKETIQLAARAGRSIAMSRAARQKMPRTHRAALIFHEAVSALNQGRCTALRSRQIIGLFFSPQLKTMDAKVFRQFLGSCFPTSDSVAKFLWPELNISDPYLPAAWFVPNRFESAMSVTVSLKNHLSQWPLQSFYLQKELDRFVQSCKWIHGEALPPGSYQVVIKGAYLDVRFSTPEDEGEHLPHLIWEISLPRPEFTLELELLGGALCWSSASKEKLRILTNFFNYRIL